VTPQFDRFPPAPLLWLILIGQVAATAAGGVLMQAASSMARLQDYEFVRRACVLGKLPLTPAWLLGLPLTLRSQTVLSRPEIRAAFDVPDTLAAIEGGAESPRRGGLFPAPWNRLSLAAVIVALAGALATYLPWLRLDVAGIAILLPGYDGGYGIATGVIFLIAALIRVLAELRQIERIWGTVASAAAATAVLVLTGLFLFDAAHPRYTSSASGDLAGNSALAEPLEALLKQMLQQSFNYTLHVGAFVALGCGVVLLGLASVEFFRHSPATERDAGL
jgi:hypothetical protein